ncbi:ribbon-helix-helix domain-containing protein [Caulobacter sp. S45]|uniref:ribbon-helix-helix domain-containing protein n=1 Tax=Caulobacter sp. S45 TaxID=1641861 RepID=UPI0015767547|nr:ribbon-helix-helix domain-containing protein [Caulobacter sp. S45]
MPSLQKKSVTLSGHETSVALEPEFWAALQTMAGEQQLGVAQLVRTVDEARQDRPLASACRVAALEWALASGRS